MRILAKITNVENGIVYYQEICRKSGKVMIEDHQQVETFKKACDPLNEYGFELVDAFECQQGSKVTNKKGKLFYIIRTLKNSVEVRSIDNEVLPHGHDLGHEKRLIRFDNNTGDYYAVGWRGEYLFSKTL